MYRSAQAPIVTGSITSGTAADITLTGNATKLLVTVKDQAVLVKIGASAATASAGDAWYIPKDVVYEIHPGPGMEAMNALGLSTAASTVYIQEII